LTARKARLSPLLANIAVSVLDVDQRATQTPRLQATAELASRPLRHLCRH